MTNSFSRLRRELRGVAMVEFALGMPVLLVTVCYATELSNYALAQLRVSQVALALADNASRVGESSNLALQQLREGDLNDALEATRKQAEQLNLTKYGRITLSSLEAGEDDVQRIHWQRCLGQKSGAGYDSSYGTAPVSAGTQEGPSYAGTVVNGGMGPTGGKVIAPTSSGVMFVEINYQYQPLFGNWFPVEPRIHYTASFIVRDRRDFTQIYPTAGITAADKMTCNRYTA